LGMMARAGLAAILVCAAVSHAALLHFSYLLDETYFAAAARDLLTAGSLVPASVLPESHPPLLYAWLALCWKLFGFSIPVARLAMLSVALLTLAAVFQMARLVAEDSVALTATALTAIYPVFFTHGVMVELDMTAAGLTLWALVAYFRGRVWRASLLFCLAVLAKETAIVAPLAVLVADLPPAGWRGVVACSGADWRARLRARLPLLAPLAALALWFVYLRRSCGYFFGAPSYADSNLSGNFHLSRAFLACLRHMWHLGVYLNLFVLTASAVVVWLCVRPVRPPGRGRRVVRVLMAVAACHVLFLCLAGSAALARYMLPIYPMVILGALQLLSRRLRWWPVIALAAAAMFCAGLFPNTSRYAFHRQDNLACLDYVALQQAGIAYIGSHAGPQTKIVTDHAEELTTPWLGYTVHAFPPAAIVDAELTRDELASAARQRPQYTLWTPNSACEPSGMIRASEWIHSPRFNQHWLSAEDVAQIMHARVVFRAQQGCDSIAVLETMASGPATAAVAP
ncbi:MAG: glycosyltransferase family 39 protein, partial [Acidobacteriota bacterium]|nr:glycosyltransferase family 39 protein [Acidobacteriota bacterium]